MASRNLGAIHPHGPVRSGLSVGGCPACGSEYIGAPAQWKPQKRTQFNYRKYKGNCNNAVNPMFYLSTGRININFNIYLLI